MSVTKIAEELFGSDTLIGSSGGLARPTATPTPTGGATETRNLKPAPTRGGSASATAYAGGETDAKSTGKPNPLLQYTLQGEATALEEAAVKQRPLLGDFCLSGQGTVISAPPNAGKTLVTLAALIEAIDGKRINGEDVFYVDADDTTQGVADKVRLLDEYGVHVLAEGYKSFRATALANALEQMIADRTASGKFVILDTFKKFTQLMHKVDTARFTDVIRRFVLAGGTLLCLAHTNKLKDASGKNVFAGVADIVDDLDCAWTVDVQDGPGGTRIMQLTNKKRRGNNPDSIAYSYSPDPQLSYVERMTTVHQTDTQIESGTKEDEKTPDEEIIESLSLAVHHGRDIGKMALVRLVAKQSNVSKRRVLLLLEQRTGDDPSIHLWRYVVRAHGLKAYELLAPPA